jgi:hypothetical protein
MPKFIDYYSDPAPKDIMQAFCEKFPAMFDGFKIDGFNIVFTKKKKSPFPVKLHSVGYPQHVFTNGKPYILEVFESWWNDMNQRQKNTSVFHVMCAIPDGGFDEQSKMFAKKLKPEVCCYMLEFAATGGVPNWFDNPFAKDPLEREADEIAGDIPEKIDPDEAIPSSEVDDAEKRPSDGIERIPVTAADIHDVIPVAATA